MFDLIQTFYRLAKVSKHSLGFWLIENVGFHPTFSRHAKVSKLSLVLWLIENVGFAFFYHLTVTIAIRFEWVELAPLAVV